MATLDPTKVANKWQTNLSNATTSITDGVNAVQVAPGQAAAAAQATMRARLLAAIDSGKWAANVSAVPLQSWKNSMITVGIPRIADGASKGKPKMQAFLASFLPYVANVQQQVRAMPNATQADREARMLQNARLLAQYKKPAGS